MKRYITILLLFVAASIKAQCPDSTSYKNDTISFYYANAISLTPTKLEIDTGGLSVATFDTIIISTLGGNTIYSVITPSSFSSDSFQSLKWRGLNKSGNLRVVASCSTSKALPVSLIYFGVEVDRNIATIKWQTASEVNSSHFLIQRYNGNWLDIDIVKSSGNSNEILTYNYTDIIDCNGRYYYRLIHFDFDGSSQEEGMVMLDITWFTNKELLYDLLGRKL